MTLHLFINSISAAQTTQMIGILHGSIGAHTITDNTVYGLLSRSTNINTSTSSAVNAIMNSSSGRSIITNNFFDFGRFCDGLIKEEKGMSIMS